MRSDAASGHADQMQIALREWDTIARLIERLLHGDRNGDLLQANFPRRSSLQPQTESA